VEVSTLKNVGMPGMRGPSPFLRLQSDERLVSITRRGNQAAYETLVARYNSRLLAFTRHMLGSREDAEDVVQETFAAAYGAMVADERPINVKPWLYRIARNRALNHMRRQTAVGVDSFEHHMADNGLTTDETVHKREDFRQLMADVRELPETQRTALLLREIDALSYEQIAEAMETTVPSVKSLLVRARVSLAEAAEARKLSCDEVREELGEVAEGLARLSPPARRHLRDCERCAGFRKSLRETNRALALMLPIGPLLILKKLMLAQVGTTASAGGGAAATTGAAGAAAGSAAGGAVSAGVTAMASKAAATVAAAAIVTAGAVEVDQVRHASPQRAQATFVAAAPAPAAAPRAKTATPPVVAHVKKTAATDDKTAKDAAPVATAGPTAQPAPAEAVAPATPVPAPVAQPAPEPVAPPAPPVQIAPEEQVDVVTLPPSQETAPPATTPAEETLPEQPPADGTTGPAEEPSTPPSGTTGPTGPAELPVTPPAVTP
jgi:RNA polymerase sigma factor (sigma-70 family)